MIAVERRWQSSDIHREHFEEEEGEEEGEGEEESEINNSIVAERKEK